MLPDDEGRHREKTRCRLRGLAGILLAAAGLACGTDAPDATATQIRSVLLITIDTLRADHLSGYGYSRLTSPQLDRFMNRGQRFRWAFSTSSRTAPSHVSMLTGLYPSATTVSVENGKYPLDPATPTLAVLVKRAGVQTAAIVSNPALNRRLGLDRGFDVYDDVLPERESNRDERERTAEHAVDAALDQLERFGSERFFLWLHLQDPHGPYTPPEAALEALAVASPDPTPATRLLRGPDHSGYGAIPRYQYQKDKHQLADYVQLYDAEIRQLDESLGRLFRYLEEEDRLGDTLVAITADHGEAFGEDGYFCAHGHGIGMDQTRVPLAFVGAGIPAGQVLSTAVSNIDLFATLLEALGGQQGLPVDSESLLPALRKGVEPKGRVGYAESVTQRAVFSDAFYLRRDRRAASDLDFWQSRNPYTGAPRHALKSLRFTSLKNNEGVERSAQSTQRLVEPAKPLVALLDGFRRRVTLLEPGLAAIRESAGERALSKDEREQLRGLGYIE